MNTKYVITSVIIFVAWMLYSMQTSHGYAGEIIKTAEPKTNPIVFSDNWLANGHLTDEDRDGSVKSIKEIDLYKTKNLYFAAFLNQPLLAHLQAIAPSLTNKQLLEKGNFRFTFYLNGEAIYTEALSATALTNKQKQQDIVLSRPLFSEAGEDSWGRFLWMRFMHLAGEEKLVENNNHLRIDLSVYADAPVRVTSGVIASGELVVNVTKPQATESDIAIQKIDGSSGWRVSAKNYNKDLIRALNKKIAEKDFKDINALVVIKNGELLIEQYYNGSDRQSLHDPRSVGKSFASTLLGMAIRDGYIKSEDQLLSDFYDLSNYKNSSTKADVSLKQLLTMSSAFDGNDANSQSIGNEENMYPTDDWVKFALDLPMRSDVNNKPSWSYFTAGVVVLGDVLNKSVPDGLESYADKKLFAPLGINHYQWQYTPQGVVNTAGGLALRAIDFAKYGQLYKNGGQWAGQQVLTNTWVEQSLSKQVPRGDDEDQGHYGYLFWNDTFPLNEKMVEVAYASGNGGNKIYIFKNIDAVVVITASAYNKAYAHSQVNKMMANYILPAIVD
jgi:CubicO group peptidase (beta-lactamase class C family)